MRTRELLALAGVMASLLSAQACKRDDAKASDKPAKSAEAEKPKPKRKPFVACGSKSACQTACDADKAAACTGLAQWHLLSSDDADTKKAEAALEKSCKADDQLGCALLASRLQYGDKEACHRAIDLADAACTKGVAAGCYWLSKVKYQRDVPDYDLRDKSDAKAIEMLAKACEGGYAAGCIDHADALDKGTFGLTSDKKKARALLQKHCDAGLLGVCQELGFELALWEKSNPKLATKGCDLLEKVCDEGNEGDSAGSACWSLADCYYNGEGRDRDLERGRLLYDKACGMRVTHACEKLKEIDGKLKAKE